MIALTDGIENTCFQIGGTGVWYSITGRDSFDPPDGMWRPDRVTRQDTEPLPPPSGVKVYGIALGDPGTTDGAAHQRDRLGALRATGTRDADPSTEAVGDEETWSS